MKTRADDNCQLKGINLDLDLKTWRGPYPQKAYQGTGGEEYNADTQESQRSTEYFRRLESSIHSLRPGLPLRFLTDLLCILIDNNRERISE